MGVTTTIDMMTRKDVPTNVNNNMEEMLEVKALKKNDVEKYVSCQNESFEENGNHETDEVHNDVIEGKPRYKTKISF